MGKGASRDENDFFTQIYMQMFTLADCKSRIRDGVQNIVGFG